MKLIASTEIEKTLGKNGFSFFPKNLSMLTYMQGLPVMDELQLVKPTTFERKLVITALPKGFELRATHHGKSHAFGILYEDVKQISLEAPEDIITKKERSVIGRAVVGGLLLGPAGALVGGMSGLQEGKKVESSDLLLTLQVVQEDQEHLIVATSPKKYKILVDKFLKKELPPLAPHIEVLGV